MLFTPYIFIELLTRKVPTVMYKFNICDTKSLKVHFHSDMFRWHTYHHHQGQRVYTKSWDVTGEISLSCSVHVFRVTPQKLVPTQRRRPALCGQCEGDFRSAYTAPAVLYRHQFLWSNSDNVYIARRTLSHHWRLKFWCEISLPDDGGIYGT
jgi:hypothetical protein